jgi:hypothetical protein
MVVVEQAVEHSGDGGAVAEQFSPVLHGFKTLLLPRKPIRAPVGVNVPGFIVGRFSDDLHWPVLGDP